MSWKAYRESARKKICCSTFWNAVGSIKEKQDEVGKKKKMSAVELIPECRGKGQRDKNEKWKNVYLKNKGYPYTFK